MKAKKISPEQFGQLLVFTRQHFVEYYDLQSELADHLANAIEERWQAQPLLTFDEALRLEFKKFGVFGFSDIVEQRQKALSKKYYKLVWKEFRLALDLRMLLIAILSAFAIYKTVQLLPWSYFAMMVLFFAVTACKLWQMRKQYKKKLALTGKKWLLEEIIFSCSGLGVMANLPLQLSQFTIHDFISPPLAALMAVVLVLLSVYDYVVLFRMPARAEMHLQKAYPEYTMEN